MKVNFIADNNLILASNQTVTTSAAAGNNATGYIDLGADFINMPSFLALFDVGTTDFGNTDETYKLEIQTSNATNFATIEGSSSVTVSSQAEIDAYKLQIPVPFVAAGRYVRAYFTPAGTSPSIVIEQAQLTGEGL